jgi:signal transduction histidine kinase
MQFNTFSPRTVRGQITGLIVLAVLLAVLLSFGAGYLIFRVEDASRPNHLPLPPHASIASVIAKAESLDEVSMILKDSRRAGLDVHRLQGRAAAKALAEAQLENRTLPRPQLDEFRAAGIVPTPSGSILVPLKNGDVVVLNSPFPQGLPRFLAFPIILVLSVAAVSIIGVSIYAARSITAPLWSFVQAASTIGRRGSEYAQVAVRGPAEIVQVAKALNDMQARIRALLDERTSMLTAISHDLRTPLTRMKLRAERIISFSELNLAEGIIRDIGQMERMLAVTLSYLRDDGRAEDIQPIDLPSLLMTMCTDLADLGNTISYEGPTHLVFFCGPTSIARAVSNIIDNALKFGDAVTVSIRQPQEGQFEIDVADDGPGIHHSLRTRVFEPFFKGDPSRHISNEGFGLGLSIAKRIVERHGGGIELLDRVPRGLCVRMTFCSSQTQIAAPLNAS